MLNLRRKIWSDAIVNMYPENQWLVIMGHGYFQPSLVYVGPWWPVALGYLALQVGPAYILNWLRRPKRPTNRTSYWQKWRCLSLFTSGPPKCPKYWPTYPHCLGILSILLGSLEVSSQKRFPSEDQRSNGVLTCTGGDGLQFTNLRDQGPRSCGSQHKTCATPNRKLTLGAAGVKYHRTSWISAAPYVICQLLPIFPESQNACTNARFQLSTLHSLAWNGCSRRRLICFGARRWRVSRGSPNGEDAAGS